MTMKVEVDWDKDGDYADTGENVTARVRGPVSVSYGRDQSTALAPVVSGRGSFALDNATRDYSPRNTTSPLYGLVKPARPVLITRTVGVDTFTLFAGHTDDSPINPDLSARSVNLSLLDALAGFRAQTIRTPLYRGVRTGEAIGLVLDACGWPAALRDLDPGATVVPWWWEDGTSALEALDKLVRSEGPPALLTMGPTGEVVFRDRHHRLLRAESLSPQSAWVPSDGVLEPVMSTPFVYDDGWRGIVNTGSLDVAVRTPREQQVVWSSDATVTLSAGEQRVVTAVSSDPFYDAVTPVSGTDFTVSGGSVTAALLATSGTSAGIVLTSVSGASVVRSLRLRANPVQVSHTVQVSAEDADSVDEYGAKSFPTDLPWCGPEDAAAILGSTVAMRAEPLTVLTVRFACGSSNLDRASLVLVRDLSDMVTVVEGETSLNSAFYVESITHDFTSELDHSVTFGLEAAQQPITPLARFDDASVGFDVGKFSDARDQPSTLARFDDASIGFDEGVFAT